jgi:hypothetical protein
MYSYSRNVYLVYEHFMTIFWAKNQDLSISIGRMLTIRNLWGPFAFFFIFFMTNLWAKIQILFIFMGGVFKIINLSRPFAFFLWLVSGLEFKICSSPWEGCSKSEISRRPYRSMMSFTIFWATIHSILFLLLRNWITNDKFIVIQWGNVWKQHCCFEFKLTEWKKKWIAKKI